MGSDQLAQPVAPQPHLGRVRDDQDQGELLTPVPGWQIPFAQRETGQLGVSSQDLVTDQMRETVGGIKRSGLQACR
jgi:hypothetical protein